MVADDIFTVTLDGGRPWGFRLQGGYEYAQRIRVAKVGTVFDDSLWRKAKLQECNVEAEPLIKMTSFFTPQYNAYKFSAKSNFPLFIVASGPKRAARNRARLRSSNCTMSN